MSREIDLKMIERKAFQSNFQDGLWDIYLGILLLQMSVGPALYRLDWSPVWVLAALAAIVTTALAAFKAAKKRIVAPRLGLVHFGEARRRKKKKLSLVLSLSILAGVVAFAIAIVAYQSANDATYALALPLLAGLYLLTAVGVCSVAAYLFDFPRAYLYGWFYGFSFPLSVWLDEQFGIAYPAAALFFSIIMILIGLTLFVRFLRDYPLPTASGERQLN